MENDVTVTLEGEDAALFAVSSSVIGRDEENGEKDIEITFTPESEGVYNATVIFSDGKGFLMKLLFRQSLLLFGIKAIRYRKRDLTDLIEIFMSQHRGVLL